MLFNPLINARYTFSLEIGCMNKELVSMLTPTGFSCTQQLPCRKVPFPKASSSLSTETANYFWIKAKEINRHFNVETLTPVWLNEGQRIYKVDRWVLVLFKLLKHQLEGIYCLHQLSLLQGQAGCAATGGLGVLIGVLNPLFLSPCSLTTSPSSNSTGHSKGLTEPSATPLS